MKKEYDEIMEHIQVTPEMRRRVLQHIQEENISASPPKIVKFPSIKRYLSVAACLSILLVGALVLPRMINQGGLEQPPVLAGQGIEEVASLQELSNLVGFEIDEELALPFDVDEISYLSYWGELAKIEYSGGEQSATFRKSIGDEDNSGDYTEYGDMTTIDVSGHSMTLKGDGGAYSLAVWTDGTYAYSLRLSNAASEDQWYGILNP